MCLHWAWSQISVVPIFKQNVHIVTRRRHCIWLHSTDSYNTHWMPTPNFSNQLYVTVYYIWNQCCLGVYRYNPCITPSCVFRWYLNYLYSVQKMKFEKNTRRISAATLSLYSVDSAVVNAHTVCGGRTMTARQSSSPIRYWRREVPQTMHGCGTMTARQSSSPIDGEKFPKLCTAVERWQHGNPAHLLTKNSSPNYARL